MENARFFALFPLLYNMRVDGFILHDKCDGQVIKANIFIVLKL